LFLWPQILPHALAEVRTTVWISVAHLAIATMVAMYLVHHLTHAPVVWWKKRSAARRQALPQQTLPRPAGAVLSESA
jgi:hypothetical protein